MAALASNAWSHGMGATRDRGVIVVADDDGMDGALSAGRSGDMGMGVVCRGGAGFGRLRRLFRRTPGVMRSLPFGGVCPFSIRLLATCVMGSAAGLLARLQGLCAWASGAPPPGTRRRVAGLLSSGSMSGVFRAVGPEVQRSALWSGLCGLPGDAGVLLGRGGHCPSDHIL